MSRRLGELGCSGKEARERLKRLMDKGLSTIPDDPAFPSTPAEDKFIINMKGALAINPNFEPSYGQIAWAMDIYEKYLL